MIGIVDYQVGNVGNVVRALSWLKNETVILQSPQQLSSKIDVLVLPGVGAFRPAVKNLDSKKWKPALRSWASDNRGLIGICLGMQLLMDASLEDGTTEGTGILEGIIEPLHLKKYPHIGWNSIIWNSTKGASGFFRKTIPDGSDFYFVHGYGLKESEHELSATTVENITFVSSVIKGNTLGFQFHPERSGRTGLKLLNLAIKYAGGTIP